MKQDTANHCKAKTNFKAFQYGSVESAKHIKHKNLITVAETLIVAKNDTSVRFFLQEVILHPISIKNISVMKN